MQYAAAFFSAGAAWYTAGLFLRLAPKEAAVDAAVSGMLCGLLSFLLPLAGIDGAWFAAVFPLLALLLPIQQRRSRSDQGLSLLLAAGAFSPLCFLCCAFRTLLPPLAALGLSCALAALFCGLGTALRQLYPPGNWREYFERREQEQFPVYLWQVWLALGVMVLLELLLPLAADTPPAPRQAAILGLAGVSLYWGAVCAVCLMTACRRQRLTALIDQDYRSEMQRFMNVIRSQRHDYNFHLQALSGLIGEGNLEDCRQYLSGLVRDSADMNTLLPIKDPAIAALIFSFRSQAQEEGIALYLDIQNDMSCVMTSVYETNKIIGNLLQNAIDEVSGHEDKSFGIHLYILKRGENCIVHVANKIAVKGDVQAYLQDVYKPGHSTKNSHEGIGLSSVRNLLERYRGVVYSRLDGDIIHFVAKIPLRLEGEAL